MCECCVVGKVVDPRVLPISRHLELLAILKYFVVVQINATCH